MSGLLDDVKNKVKNSMTVTEAYAFIRTVEDDDDDEEDLALEQACDNPCDDDEDADLDLDTEDEAILNEMSDAGDPTSDLGDDDLQEDDDNMTFDFEGDMGAVMEALFEDDEDDCGDVFDSDDDDAEAMYDRIIDSLGEEDDDEDDEDE